MVEGGIFMNASRKNRIKLSKSDLVYQIIIFTVVGIVAFICVFPLLYVVGMSLTSEGEMIRRNYFVIIPHDPTLRAYQTVFSQASIGSAMLVSIGRTLLGSVASLVFPILGGYILSRIDLPGRKAFLIFFIITMILSGGMIPTYLLMKKLHLINTFWVYIIPAMGSCYNMLIIKMFVENMPLDIMESADLDGASELQKMMYIAIPLLVPTICAIWLFSAVGQWNSWFDVMLYIHNPKLYSLSYVVKQLMTSFTFTDTTANLQPLDRMTPEGLKMASVVIAVVPILCIYPFLQKYFIYGVYTGSVKG
ncbi:hypothetical protein CDQ84_08685 [Clostridium thermosuccinogenes]|uniref:ABC transmembrane type-1 domain-containing protein n=2 Tax=Clostridium thermosuccinogenes TaxID=84032 RepID=A0A2K2FEZ4_9CLOT|nr:hypothetical protein CDO33_14985 [Pseudoclostridium thermosuccinogenes]PNT97345.1 hypothetical protein CDQ85_08535 [Pseudoclostridium thermosuccinogenes]PNT99281.1 hypothetical protein CDQ84_08685 [Pseudoclostridium thermosuccinogenes]